MELVEATAELMYGRRINGYENARSVYRLGRQPGNHRNPPQGERKQHQHA
jgi:hypothetical protein